RFRSQTQVEHGPHARDRAITSADALAGVHAGAEQAAIATALTAVVSTHEVDALSATTTGFHPGRAHRPATAAVHGVARRGDAGRPATRLSGGAGGLTATRHRHARVGPGVRHSRIHRRWHHGRRALAGFAARSGWTRHPARPAVVGGGLRIRA